MVDEKLANKITKPKANNSVNPIEKDNENFEKENEIPKRITSTVTVKTVSADALRAKKLSKRPRSPRENNNVTNTLNN